VDPRLADEFDRGSTIDARLGAADLSSPDIRDLVERATSKLLSTAD
jgi:hypothetical protein